MINLEMVIINEGKVVTSSLQVAESFGKEHRNVTRDIENLTAQNGAVKNMFYEDEYTNDRGRKYKIYYMNRDGFTLLAMGFTGKTALEFKLKYIEQFNKMEEQLKNNIELASYMIDDPIKRAEKWIEEQKEKQELQQQLMIAEPKADKYDDFLNADGYLTGEKSAKALGIGRNTLYKFLRENEIWTKDNIPYQRFIDRELFKVIPKMIVGVGITSVTLFTTKGVDYVADKLKKNK